MMSSSNNQDDPGQLIRLLLQAIQRNKRETVIQQLVEIGLWLGITPGPLPSPKVATISAAALAITLSELQSTIQQHRDMSANIQDRDSSRVAAIIERNTEMIESVARALAALTPNAGFLMVED